MGKSLGWVVPVALGVIAGVLYIAALRSGTKPIELVAIKSDAGVKAGNELKAEDLTPVSIRADKTLLRSAVKWEDRGLVIGRKVNRPLLKDELVLFADVRQSAADFRQNLLAGEESRTVSVPLNRIVPGLRIGDDAQVILRTDIETETGKGGSIGERSIGRYRVIGLGERGETALSRDDSRLVVLAIKVNSRGEPLDQAAKELVEALEGKKGERIIGIEFAGPAR